MSFSNWHHPTSLKVQHDKTWNMKWSQLKLLQYIAIQYKMDPALLQVNCQVSHSAVVWYCHNSVWKAENRALLFHVS